MSAFSNFALRGFCTKKTKVTMSKHHSNTPQDVKAAARFARSDSVIDSLLLAGILLQVLDPKETEDGSTHSIKATESPVQQKLTNISTKNI